MMLNAIRAPLTTPTSAAIKQSISAYPFPNMMPAGRSSTGVAMARTPTPMPGAFRKAQRMAKSVSHHANPPNSITLPMSREGSLSTMLAPSLSRQGGLSMIKSMSRNSQSTMGPSLSLSRNPSVSAISGHMRRGLSNISEGGFPFQRQATPVLDGVPTLPGRFMLNNFNAPPPPTPPIQGETMKVTFALAPVPARPALRALKSCMKGSSRAPSQTIIHSPVPRRPMFKIDLSECEMALEGMQLSEVEAMGPMRSCRDRPPTPFSPADFLQKIVE